MINYFYLCVIKPQDWTTTQLHLFEHAYYRKLIDAIKPEFAKKGIVIEAHTFTTSVFLEVYYTDTQFSDTLRKLITDIQFTSEDLAMIAHEKNILFHEISELDLSEEDIILYEGLRYISQESIYSLYERDETIDMSTIVERFNTLLEMAVILHCEGGVIEKFQFKPHGVAEKSIVMNLGVHGKHVIGGLRLPMISLEAIVEAMFLSFVYAKTDEAFLHKTMIEPFNLYWGYTLDLPLYHDYVILFFIETTKESRQQFEKKGLADGTVQVDFEKQKSAFRTFLELQDPQLREFCRFFAQSQIPDARCDKNSITHAIELINEDRIARILSEGGALC